MSLKYLSKLSILAALGITLLGALPAHSAGTIPLALAVQFDTTGVLASGCQATFYQAGTVATKQNVFSDFGLTQALANPLSCDQAGRLPMFWIADGLIHVRLTTSAGNPIVDTTMQVLGPSSGGGGGGSTIDPTTILAAGDLKVKYGTGPLSGFVRANGLTIGNGSSGAGERANADTQALFVYLCGADANLVMTPARSGNCLSDYNANKQLALPDMRGLALAALDDMGNSARGIYAGVTFSSGNATTLGSGVGASRRTLLATQLPSNIPYTDPGHTHSASWEMGNSVSTGDFPPRGITNTGVFKVVNVAAATTGITINPSGGQAFDTVSPYMLATFYLKL
jgi:hypothetical protein